VRKGFHDPYSNDGHGEGLAGDGLSEWHLSVPTGLVAALPQDWQQGAEHFRRWPEKEHRGVKKGNEFGASRPENRFQPCPALPSLPGPALPQPQSMPSMVPGIDDNPQRTQKGQQTKRRACLWCCPQTAVAEAPTTLLTLIRCLSLRLKPKAAAAPRAGSGPGTASTRSA